MVEADGAADVVERAQHAGDVAKREVGPSALGHRAQRLAFEVEQHPSAGGMLQHLAQVVVAVDALHRRPLGFEGARVDRLDRLPPLGDRRAPRRSRSRAGGATTRATASRSSRSVGTGGEELGERDVHLGGRGAERPGRSAEVLTGGRRAQRHPPGVLDARQELLREGERALDTCPVPSHRRASGPRSTRSPVRRAASRPRRARRRARCRGSGRGAAGGRPCR